MSVMNIAQVLEQARNDLDENDWYFLHYQCQVLVLGIDGVNIEGICSSGQLNQLIGKLFHF